MKLFVAHVYFTVLFASSKTARHPRRRPMRLKICVMAEDEDRATEIAIKKTIAKHADAVLSSEVSTPVIVQECEDSTFVVC